MKPFVQFIIRFFSAGAVSVTTFLTTLFTGQGWASVVYGGIGFLVTFYLLKWIMHNTNIKNTGLTRREYKYIQQNLKEAKAKIRRLQRAFFSVNGIMNAKQSVETLRIIHKINSITKKEPIRFYKAEEFYFSHLDSFVEISEKYALLSSQPAKTRELSMSLNETRKMMDQLSDTVRDDLYKVLEKDIDTLQFELDVAKKRIDHKDPRDRRITK